MKLRVWFVVQIIKIYSMPKVTVIIPVYGVEKYIERCARSLFEQTLDDMEFIFVDDCSPDRSIEILESILEEYPVRRSQSEIVRLPKNGGLPHARKTGLQQATGEYILHCDSDDWVDVTMCEKLYSKAVAEDADMVICDWYRSNGSKHVIHQPREISIERDAYLRAMICRERSMSIRNKLVRKGCYYHPIDFPVENNGEDFCLILQLFYYCHTISFVTEPLYYYYLNPDSLTQIEGYEQVDRRAEQNMKNYSIVDKFFKQKGIDKEYENELLMLRFDLKCYLLPNAGTKQGLIKWHSTYPELTIKKVLSLKRVPLYRKLLYMLAPCGIYSILKRIKRMIFQI